MSAVVVTSMEQTRHATRPADRYFVNAPIDGLLIGGASVVLYALFRLRPELASSPSVASLAATLVWVCNYPHFASTNYRLYHSRSSIAQYPMTSFVTPLMVSAAVIGCYMSPNAVAPMFIKLYLLWSPYHFSGQTLGITMVYARRSGFVIDGWLRRSLTAFIFLTFLVQNAWAEVGRHVNPFYGVDYPTLGVPVWLPQTLTKLMWIALAVTIALLIWQIVNSGPRVPWIVLLPAFTQYVWFVATPAGQFAYMVPFFHSLQYLLIAWNVQLKEGLGERRRDPSVRYVWSESTRWMTINIVGGYILFWGLPQIGSQFGKPLVFSTAVILAAIQIHHFFVDGVIWRLHNPAARSPLTSSLKAVSGRS
ncbi:MAG: hypothetical protein ABI894_11120 [Ilumatobacteraceae bacterium]